MWPALENLSTKRGDVAHKGFGVRRVDTPSAIKACIDSAMKETKLIDEHITNPRIRYKLGKAKSR